MADADRRIGSERAFGIAENLETLRRVRIFPQLFSLFLIFVAVFSQILLFFLKNQVIYTKTYTENI